MVCKCSDSGRQLARALRCACLVLPVMPARTQSCCVCTYVCTYVCVILAERTVKLNYVILFSLFLCGCLYEGVHIVPLYLLYFVGGVHLCRLFGTTPTQSNGHTPSWYMHCIGVITSSSPLPIDPAPSSFLISGHLFEEYDNEVLASA